MIYSLFNHFNDVLGARLFTYISFRAILAGVIALLVSVFFGDYFINLLKRKNISETQRDEKTDPFNVAKKGVPTLGGIVIIGAMLVAVLLMGKLSNIYMILMIATTLMLGALGLRMTISRHSATTKTDLTVGSRLPVRWLWDYSSA